MLNIECWSPPDADGPSFSEADGHIQAAGGLRRNASSAALKTPPTKYARMSTFPEETGNGANGHLIVECQNQRLRKNHWKLPHPRDLR